MRTASGQKHTSSDFSKLPLKNIHFSRMLQNLQQAQNTRYLKMQSVSPLKTASSDQTLKFTPNMKIPIQPAVKPLYGYPALNRHV
jgi:hypothetical protein